MALVKTRRKMWGRWQERRDFRPRWPPHAAFTEIRPRRAETHPILVGVMMDASILLPPSRAGRAAGRGRSHSVYDTTVYVVRSHYSVRHYSVHYSVRTSSQYSTVYYTRNA